MGLREYAAEQARKGAGEEQRNAAPAFPYQDTYKEVFNFHKRHAPYPADLEEWQAAAEDMREVSNRLHNPLADSFLIAVYTEYQRLAWEQKR